MLVMRPQPASRQAHHQSRRHWRPRVLAWLALAAFVCLTSIELSAADKNPDLFDEIYKRSAATEASLKTIKAHFIEETTSSLLAKPLIAEGTLEASRPSDLVLTYTKPEKKTIRVNATTMVFSWPDRNINETSDISQAQKRVQQYFVNKSPDELRKHFAIAASEDPKKPGTYLLAMTPKRKQIQQGMSRLDLWLTKDTLMLAAMRMTFPNGDAKTMTFDQVQLNAPVAAASSPAK
jgi:outer membrane lipoprotein-sorting protein